MLDVVTWRVIDSFQNYFMRQSQFGIRMCLTIEQWAIIIPTILVLMGWVIDWVRANKMLELFPKYQIIYSVQPYEKENSKKAHHLTVHNVTDKDLATDYRWFYATASTNGWRELKNPGRSGRIYAKKGEKAGGGWYPFWMSTTQQDKKRFYTNIPESPIIWRFDYKSKWYWHSSYEIFIWKGEKWVSKHWDGYYANGNWAFIHGLRNYFSDKARKKIKEWKKKQ